MELARLKDDQQTPSCRCCSTQAWTAPTHGIDSHIKEEEYFFSAFPDNYVQNCPYKIFAQDECMCHISEFTGTHKGTMMNPGCKKILPTNKKFKVDFCTVARWKDGMIIEENLFFHVVVMMTQLGIM